MGRALAAAAVAVTLLGGCGAPEELSEKEGRTLADARERLDDAIDTEETLRTSRAQARRIRRQTQRIVSDGSFEQATLDEFGLAKLGELREVVPSLVLTDSDGVPRALDRRAAAEFLRYAGRDAARALLRPAGRQVSLMLHVLEEGDAGEETEIPVVNETAEAFLREAQRDVGRIWPPLGRRLAEAANRL